MPVLQTRRWVPQNGQSVAESGLEPSLSTPSLDSIPTLPPSIGPGPQTPRGSPSAEARGLSLREARKRVRSLKLQLFCTLVGLVASHTCSLLGEVATDGGARCCLEGPVRRWELPMRIRSLMPIRLLEVQVGWGREPS